MRKLLFILLAFGFVSCTETKTEYLEISVEEYTDRVKAMWLAQLVAVHQGWDYEHRPAAVQDITFYSPKRLSTIIKNGAATIDDDWYYEMVALWGFEKYGVNMTVEELGQQWLDYNMGTWGSAFYTRKALKEGHKGADAGFPKNNRMWFTVGNQNRSDLYAMITPGMPNLTASISRELGHVNSYAEGTDGGVLIGGMSSIAFYEKDPQVILRKALSLLHPQSPHRICGEQIITIAESGASWEECMQYVEERWGIEYPGTNSAVWNAGFAMVALYFGEGDFMKSINIAYQASDFSDADCQAANVGTVLAAMHGTKILPEEMITPFNNRMKGDKLGFMDLIEPVDTSLDELAERTVAVGLKLMQKHGVKIKNNILYIPIQHNIITQELEYFHPNEFVKWWDAEWNLSRAGFGAPGGGLRGIRGGTFVDDSLLVTYPRDEVRGVKLQRTITPGQNTSLLIEVAADPGRTWQLILYINQDEILRKNIYGGAPLEWPEAPEYYPQPLHEYEACAAARKFQTYEVDLRKYAGQEITIRAFQNILVRNGFPGNAYWKHLSIIDKE